MGYDINYVLAKLYEQCFDSSAPFVVLGEQLLNSFKLAAVSLWMDNPRVKSTSSRLIFSHNKEVADIIEKDQDLAYQVLNSDKALSDGFLNDWHYWAMPLKGKHTICSLVLWADKPFDLELTQLLVDLPDRLAKLLDLIVGLNTASSQRVTRELQTTRFFQQQLMPSIQIANKNISLAYRVLPAHELGGDYLDILPYKNGTIGLTVADAMGKGVPGAFVMLVVRTIFRVLARERDLPSTVLCELNNQCISELAQLDSFVTQFYGIYRPTQRKLIYANAGHNQPLVWRKSIGKVTVLSGRGIAIGGKADADYSSFSIELDKGDILIVFSDGLKEVRDADNREFGLNRISLTLRKYQEYSAEGICDGLINTVMRQCGKQTDDMSFLVLKV